jgi:putative spermidine/putrescine transport system permease protein
MTDATAIVASRQWGRGGLSARGLDRRLLLGLPAALFLLLLFVYPFIYGLMLSFQPSQGGPFGSYRSFFADPYLRGAIGNTLELALPVALLNVLAAMAAAYPMRRAARGRRLLSTMLIVPITFGMVLVSDGMLTYLGPNGWLNTLLTGLGIVDQPLTLIHNYIGVFIALMITGFPFAFLLALSHVSGIDPAFEKAAAALGARPWQRFRRVVLPLWAPGLAITFCLMFMQAFSVFPSAELVGDPSGSTHVLSIVAYFEAYQRYDYSMASAVTMVTTVIEMLVIGLALFLRSRVYRGSATVGKG